MVKQLFVLLLLTGLLSLFFYQGWLDFVYPISKPIFKVSHQISKTIYQSFYLLTFIDDLHRENQRLIEHNHYLLSKLSHLQKTQKENQLLRQQLNLKSEENNLQISLASVISAGQEVLISTQKENYPVMTAGKVLIGKTVKGGHLRLITHQGIKIPAYIKDTDVQGIVKSHYQLHLKMPLLPLEAPLEEGDLVLTSGAGGQWPRDLILGRISQLKKNEKTTTQTAFIKPQFQKQDLQKVFLVTNF